MSVQVKRGDLILARIYNKYINDINQIVEITDEEAEQLGIIEPSIEPIPYNPPAPVEDDHDYSQDYLTFEALEDGTFSFTVNDLYYSINNGETWKSLAAGTNTELITAGTKVLWKGDSNMINNRFYSNYQTSYGSYQYLHYGTFNSTCKFNAFGNIHSLYINSCVQLFKNCNKLINTNNLIIPIINNSKVADCFQMFYGCELLTTTPLLPATTLSSGCYIAMFENCTSLITAPELPAITLANNCYNSMFSNCTSLNYIKCLAENIVSDNIGNWVKDVPAGGTFIKNSQATYDIGASGIPTGWEVIDEVVPEE